ncbi:hypothetical protein ACHQM5_030335 [Ranunculus cassubicifolius]
MKISRLLFKALTFTPQSSHRHLIPLQSFLYSTTTTSKSSKSYSKKQTKSPLPPPPKLPNKEWGRPSEIPWQAKVANSVNLIGRVATPVQFQSSHEGKSWAGTVLTQEKSNDVPLWIPIIFEGDLAHVAAYHLKEQDFVHVAGQLTGDPPQCTKEPGQTNIQVMVNSLSFVEETLQKKEMQNPKKQEEQVPTSSPKEVLINEDIWHELLANPYKWWDNRLNKINPKGEDFRHKESGEKLWIDESTPGWVVSKLESLNFVNKKVEEKSSTTSSSPKSGGNDLENSWRDLFDNPDKWWDNRKKKADGLINARSPDFKAKAGGVALWLNRAPVWVRSKLGGEEDVKTEEVTASPKTRQSNNNKDDAWKNLLENPGKWWDNRFCKVNPRGPDFKHKDSGNVLWVSSAPAWVVPQLPPVKGKEIGGGKIETLLS